MRSNYHTHSRYCDGKGEPREYVEFALANGFTALFRIVQDSVGINSVDNPFINVFPNPSHGMVTITLNQPAVVTITDLHGRIFHRWRLTTPNTNLFASTDTKLPKGIYFIQASTSSGTSIKKIIIE